VQRIISDTKELKNIKVKDGSNNNKADLNRRIAIQYKDPEEYYQEILELKKVRLENTSLVEGVIEKVLF
jgi:hypothetical protein